MTLKREETETGYLDVLRVYAVAAVVVFHVFAVILESFGEIISRKEYFISVMLVNIWQVARAFFCNDFRRYFFECRKRDNCKTAVEKIYF